VYGRYHELKPPEEKEVLAKITLNRQLSEEKFTLNDLAFILCKSRASAQRIFDLFRANNSE
jgi:hypothetical protein